MPIWHTRAAFTVFTLAVVFVRPAPAQSPSLDEVLARVAAYVVDFIPRFANVVAVETYEQRAPLGIGGMNAALTGSVSAPPTVWVLKSDVLLVRDPGSPLDWVVFRDVAEANGKEVHHEPDRLMKLFAAPTVASVQRAAAIAAESARYHIPGGSAAVTNPLLVLALMQPRYQSRMRFSLGGEERSLGPGVRVLQFEELEERTQSTRLGGDVTERIREKLPPILEGVGRIRGNAWIDSSTGRIVKTEGRIESGATSTTTFAVDERLALTVPKEMRTTWMYVDERRRAQVTGVAKYADFRRFDVQTDSAIAEPSKP